LVFQFIIPAVQLSLVCLCFGRKLILDLFIKIYKKILKGDPEYLSMALYNGEAVNGFPTGNLSLRLLNKINPQQIHFACFEKLFL
jgi:hypothetical protein